MANSQINKQGFQKKKCQERADIQRGQVANQKYIKTRSKRRKTLNEEMLVKDTQGYTANQQEKQGAHGLKCAKKLEQDTGETEQGGAETHSHYRQNEPLKGS